MKGGRIFAEPQTFTALVRAVMQKYQSVWMLRGCGKTSPLQFPAPYAGCIITYLWFYPHFRSFIGHRLLASQDFCQCFGGWRFLLASLLPGQTFIM